MSKRGVLDISFGWIFALVAGAIILFFAIFFSGRLINTQQEVKSAEVGTEIAALINPLETSFESAQTTSITISSESRIHNGCDLTGNFGEQIIQIDQQSFGKWTQTDIDVEFENKYIFSPAEIEGRKFYIFSKQFQFPFKIADLMYMTSANQRYCFVSAPNEIEDEIIELNQSNLIVENCSSSDIQVCFNGNACDVNVDFNAGVVEKNGDIVYFSGRGDDVTPLMYAAVFSDKDTYECQVHRLLMRLRELSMVYQTKESLTLSQGCDSNLRNPLYELNDLISSYTNSGDLSIIRMKIIDIEEKNNARMCVMW